MNMNQPTTLLASLSQTADQLTAARCVGNLHVTWQGVSTDSRQIMPGNLFVALRGERFDAHEFLPAVQLAGATVLLVEALPEGMQLLPQVAAIIVPDTRLALGQLAAAWRAQFALPLIAVTGSNGKTTVKEMIAAMLRAAYGEAAMLATRGNLNNDIGLPLSAMRLGAQHRAAVLELGMNHVGEIAQLAQIAQPTVALVNNAQREHQEFMSSVQAVAQENGSVFQALPSDGVAVFPYGTEFSALWQEYAGARRVLRFGLQSGAEVFGSYQADAFGSKIEVRIQNPGADICFSLQLAAAGEHNVLNALAAIACCHAVAMPVAAMVSGLQAFAPVQGRLQQKTSPHGALVIDDTYNANPDSVRAAIDVLAGMAQSKTLVLGDMGEVGENGAAFHAEIGGYAASQGIQHLYCLGELSRHAVLAFQTFQTAQATSASSATHCSTLAELLAALDSKPEEQQGASCILVKGSRFMQMERVVQHLLAESASTTQRGH